MATLVEDSRISGFYKLPREERIKKLAQVTGIPVEEFQALSDPGSVDMEILDHSDDRASFVDLELLADRLVPSDLFDRRFVKDIRVSRLAGKFFRKIAALEDLYLKCIAEVVIDSYPMNHGRIPFIRSFVPVILVPNSLSRKKGGCADRDHIRILRKFLLNRVDLF